MRSCLAAAHACKSLASRSRGHAVQVHHAVCPGLSAGQADCKLLKHNRLRLRTDLASDAGTWRILVFYMALTGWSGLWWHFR